MIRKSVRLIAVIAVLCLLVQALAVSAIAAPQTKPIRVGYFDLEDFMAGASENATKTGYAYDLMSEIASVNGWTYEFVYGDFSDLLEMLYAGKIDLLPCVVYSDERADTLLFSKECINEEYYFISTLTKNAANARAAGIKCLSGARIATVTDAYQNGILEAWLEKNGIRATFVYTGSFADTWESLRLGEADFVLNIDNSAPDTGFTALFEVGSSGSYFVGAPGRGEIIRGIDDAVETIRQINPFALTHLQEKYLSGTLSSYRLSDDEEAWIADHPLIRVGGLSDDIPYSYELDGTVTGVFPEIFSEVMKNLAVEPEVEWRLYDSMEQLHDALAEGEIDLICPEYHNHYLAQTKGVILSECITELTMGILSPGDESAAESKIIAAPSTRLDISYVAEFYPEATVILCDSVAACVSAVRSGRAHAAIANISALQAGINAYRDAEKYDVQVLKNPCEVCFCARPEDPEAIRILNRGLHLVPDSTIEALELKHTPQSEGYSFRDFLRENLLLLILGAAAVLLLIIFLIERTVTSGKLKRNLVEISAQKMLIEEKETELIKAKDSANAANSAKTAFLFNMSHDIRTPMNAIIGYTALAKKQCTGQPQVKSYLEKIDIAGNNLLSIVNQVLEMSRIEAGRIEFDDQPVDLVENLAVQKAIVESNASLHGITLICRAEGVSDPHVLTDAGKLNQVITNILGNAIKYTKEGGTVTYTVRQIGLEQNRGTYEFQVADTGIGMSKEFVTHIFDQFSREKNSTVSGIQGTGLGMSIVKRIVSLMGGEIAVESEQGKGTTVTVHLPMQLSEEAVTATAADVTENADFSGKRVLLVEDNEMNREIASEILSEHGFIVEEAEDGDVAVRMVSESADGYYDFVLMDVQMPNMDGYTATGLIRKLERPALAKIPIIAVSANAFEEDRQKSFAAGMDDHIAKPIDVQLLFGALARCLSE